jgi:hypothetical protein
METFEQNEKLRIQLQEFTKQLNREPDPKEFDKTPDNKASFLPVSFIEMTLDEIFLGQWEVSDIQYSQIFNEVVGTGILTVWHPITGRPLKRAGFGAVVITQDKDASIADFNMTKKKNALDLTFPKLKAEITKNAAQTLGKIFGRDINRKQKDVFKPALKELGAAGFADLVKRVENGENTLVPLAESAFLLSTDQKLVLEGLNGQKQLTNG